jgi:hypothetical protein
MANRLAAEDPATGGAPPVDCLSGLMRQSTGGFLRLPVHPLQEHECSCADRDYDDREQNADCHTPEDHDAHRNEHERHSGMLDFLGRCLGDEHFSS